MQNLEQWLHVLLVHLPHEGYLRRQWMQLAQVNVRRSVSQYKCVMIGRCVDGVQGRVIGRIFLVRLVAELFIEDARPFSKLVEL